MVTPKWKRIWIDTVEGLAAVIEDAKPEVYITLDTETVGWETGNERLALVQVGIPSKKRAYIIDPLAVQELKSLDAILSTSTPQVVAHNAPFEERQFGRFGIKIKGIRDTLVMARELRSDLPNHTLQTCCRLLLGIEISKEEQTSDWSRRPLSEEQLQYAALDVEVAAALYENLFAIEARLTLDRSLSVPDMMKLMAETVRDRFDLTREIAPELAHLNARYEMLRTAIRVKLIDGEPSYEGPYGKCSVSKIKRTEVNPQKVRREFPEIAEQVITDFVDRKTLQAVMKEYGIHPDKIDDVSDITGWTERLSLSLKDLT